MSARTEIILCELFIYSFIMKKETHDVLDFIIVRNIEYENGEGA